MKTWSDLYVVLKEIVDNVYYQPPENLKLKYPCIIYERSNAVSQYADNIPYKKDKRYTVTLITKTADNDEYLDKILDLPMCTFDREFKNDNLVHDVFTIYF